METLPSPIEVRVQLKDANDVVIWDVNDRWPVDTSVVRIMRTASTEFHLVKQIPTATPIRFLFVHAAHLKSGTCYPLSVQDRVAVPSLLVGRVDAPAGKKRKTRDGEC